MTRSHREVLTARQNIDMELTTPERRRAILCPLCPANIDSSKTLIKHACKDHGFQGRVMTKQFGNREDFMVWKEEQERRTATIWSCYSCFAKNGLNIKYYKCSRSRRRRVGETKKRRSHSKATTSACTSFLKTVENECSRCVEVEYCESHLGHSVSADSLPMHHDESNTVIGLSDVTTNEPFVEYPPVTEKSSGYAFNNNSIGSDIPEEDTSRENCMNIRIRTERMLDYLSAYIRRLASKGNTEVQSELEQVERGIEAVIDKLTFDKELPVDSSPPRRAPPKPAKQMRKKIRHSSSNSRRC
nr:unnamed protein product [Haemonchus contortus]